MHSVQRGNKDSEIVVADTEPMSRKKESNTETWRGKAYAKQDTMKTHPRRRHRYKDMEAGSLVDLNEDRTTDIGQLNKFILWLRLGKEGSRQQANMC